MSINRQEHTQQTFLTLGDEFLIQYFLCAHEDFRKNQILSRLFSMGHSLELYAKAALVSADGIAPTGHDVPELIKRCDPALALTVDEIAAGETLFNPKLTNFDMGLWQKHSDALELYQAQHNLMDLKYYLTKYGELIYPVKVTLAPINKRYLSLIKSLRSMITYRTAHHDQQLVALVEQLGFEINPASLVITTA